MTKKKVVEKEMVIEEPEVEIPPTPSRGFDLLFNNDSPELEESNIAEKTLEKALEEMFSTEGIDLKSDINNTQIVALTRGYIFATVYKSGYMADLVRHILELSVSKNREGRKEFVKLLQAAQGTDTNQEPLKLMRRRLLE